MSRTPSGELPYDEITEEDALAACNSVMKLSSLGAFSIPNGSVFVCGNFAFDYNGAGLSLSNKVAQGGVLVDAATYGLTEYDFSSGGIDAGAVKVYVPVAWSLSIL